MPTLTREDRLVQVVRQKKFIYTEATEAVRAPRTKLALEGSRLARILDKQADVEIKRGRFQTFDGPEDARRYFRSKTNASVPRKKPQTDTSALRKKSSKDSVSA